jgi:hypothetical protein
MALKGALRCFMLDRLRTFLRFGVLAECLSARSDEVKRCDSNRAETEKRTIWRTGPRNDQDNFPGLNWDERCSAPGV